MLVYDKQAKYTDMWNLPTATFVSPGRSMSVKLTTANKRKTMKIETSEQTDKEIKVEKIHSFRQIQEETTKM